MMRGADRAVCFAILSVHEQLRKKERAMLSGEQDSVCEAL
jgi:hypothetical protein